MSIEVTCPHCHRFLRLPNELAGRTGACPACRGVLEVPFPEPPEPKVDEEEEPEPPPPLVKPGKESLKVHDLVDMTAMVDIVFFLLIFFLVTSMQGIVSSIGMPNPDQQKAGAKSAPSAGGQDPSMLVVRVDHDSVVWVEGDEVLSEQELRTKLKSLREGDSAVTKMVVQAHGEALYSTVVMVLDSGNDVGMEEVRLAVVDDESEGAQ